MPKHGKKFAAAAKKVEKRLYTVPEAVATMRSAVFAKFDETVELAMRLGVDPKHADQMVRGTVVLPHGGGKTVRVAVIAAGEKVKEATAAGADHVGGADLGKKIQEGVAEFDAVVATPDMMKDVGKLGKVLGPRGLMPNPKTGTVTFDVAKAIKEIKAGKVEFRVDKTAIIHVPIGKVSFDEAALEENMGTLVSAIVKAKPTGGKGHFIRTITMTTTMGPGIKLDPTPTLAMKAG